MAFSLITATRKKVEKVGLQCTKLQSGPHFFFPPLNAAISSSAFLFYTNYVQPPHAVLPLTSLSGTHLPGRNAAGGDREKQERGEITSSRGHERHALACQRWRAEDPPEGWKKHFSGLHTGEYLCGCHSHGCVVFFISPFLTHLQTGSGITPSADATCRAAQRTVEIWELCGWAPL